MLHLPFVILSETKLDYKYRSIFKDSISKHLSLTFVQYFFSKYPKDNNSVYIYHIRYIKWRGYLYTLPSYMVIIFLSKIRKIPILFTCHNLIEHRFPSKLYSKVVRNIIIFFSDSTIVFHKDIKHALGDKSVHVSNFGDFRKFVEQISSSEDTLFRQSYRKWLRERKITSPDIVFIGRYTKYNRVDVLIDFIENQSEYYSAVVSDGIPYEVKSPNLFIFNQVINKEMEFFHTYANLIGFVAVTNHSISTSTYVYASFGIPIISFKNSPTGSIIQKYQLGETIENISDIGDAIFTIKNNYEFYSRNSKKFIKANNWTKANKKHFNILKAITNKNSQ
jgi:hypothetical protein